MTDVHGAYNDTMGRVKLKWDTTGFPIKFPNAPADTALQALIDTGTTPWARVTYLPNLREQSSIAGPTGSKETAQGLVIVQVFTPTGDGGLQDRTLTALVETAFVKVSTPNGVWYRKVRTECVGQEGFWWHSNVIAEWSYDEVR